MPANELSAGTVDPAQDTVGEGLASSARGATEVVAHGVVNDIDGEVIERGAEAMRGDGDEREVLFLGERAWIERHRCVTSVRAPETLGGALGVFGGEARRVA